LQSDVLKDRDESYVRSPFMVDMMTELVGGADGLLLSDGTLWKMQR
jgi:hypothetical protein